MTKLSHLFAVGAVLAACLAAVAFGHEGNVLDLDGLEQYVAQQDAATIGGVKSIHRAWKNLDKKLARDAKGVFAVDLGKLAALSKAANGPLVIDAQLRALLDAALDGADTKLQAQPDEIATLIGQIKLLKNQTRVLTVVGLARGLHVAGKTARDGGNETAQIKDWTKANAKFRAAVALARQIIKRQGGPLPQFKTAAAARVYTVVGEGEGGFNGDGKEARRTSLYFVEECRIGPDGLLYILDWNNHKVRRRTADGRIEAVCGSGTPGDSEGLPAATDLNHPSSLVFEPTNDGTLGKIYLAAWHNHKVKVYDPSGGPDPRYTGHGPRVYTIAGTVQGGGIVSGVDTSGDGNLATVAKYNLLPGIVRLPNGDLLTADAANEVIRRIALSTPTVSANLVGTQVATGQITLFGGTRGATGISGDDGLATACTLNFSKAQNAEPDGRMELSPDHTKLYVICGQGNCIRVVDLTANPPTIKRFAGTGAAGYAGDGGPATAALLSRPSDIAVAADGTVFFSDSYNNVIRKVAPDGTISTYAGSPTGASGAAADDIPVASAVFRHPAGLELDADGNLYVCDRENSVIRVITPPVAPATPLQVPVAPYVIPALTKGGPPAKGTTGTIDTYAGSGTLGFNGDGHPSLETDLYWPQDVAVDPNLGLVYMVDWNNHRIRRIENNGNVTTVVGSGLLGDTGGEGPLAKMNHPTDITFHPTTGDLWIAAWHTDKIIRVDSATSKLFYMAGNKRAFSGDGLAASVPTTGFDASPDAITGLPPATPAGMSQMNIPVSVKFLADGTWYVSDQGNERIRVVDGATDVINTIAGDGTADFGGDNGPAASAKINVPVGQAAQPAGRICISPDERYLYIADTGNNRIRRIDLQDALTPRQIVTYVGNGAAAYTGDGGQATSAALNYPTDVDCDADGNLYIADRDNNAVRRVDAVTHVITRSPATASRVTRATATLRTRRAFSVRRGSSSSAPARPRDASTSRTRTTAWSA